MKHLLKYLPLALLASLASCSNNAQNGSEPQDMIDMALEKAEKAIPLDETGIFSPMVCQSKRNAAAEDTLKAILHTRVQDLVNESQTTKDDERKRELENEISSYFEIGDSLLQELRQRNEVALQKVSQDLIGKPLPAEADPHFFSKAEAKIAEIQEGGNVIISFKATTSTALSEKFHLVFADSNKAPLMAAYPVWCSSQTAGSTFEGTTSMHISVISQTKHLIFTE